MLIIIILPLNVISDTIFLQNGSSPVSPDRQTISIHTVAPVGLNFSLTRALTNYGSKYHNR